MSKNNKIVYIRLLFLAIGVDAIISLSFSALTTYAKKSNNVVKVHLTKGISTGKLIKLSKDSNVKPAEIYFSQGEINGGYKLQPENNIRESIQDLEQKHKEFLNTALSNTNQRLAGVTGTDKEQRLRALQSQLNSAKSLTQSQGIKISAIKVANNNNSFVRSLKAKNLVKEIEEKPNIKEQIQRHAVKAWYGFTEHAASVVM